MDVFLVGDVNGDHLVDKGDLDTIHDIYRSQAGDANYQTKTTDQSVSGTYRVALTANDRIGKTITGWDIDWGDGESDRPDVVHYTAAQVAALEGQVAHDYADPARSYAVTITATDKDGRVYTTTGAAQMVESAYFLGADAVSSQPVAGSVVGRTVAIQSNGKMVVAEPDSAGNFVLSRYNADGSLDTSFGVKGTAATELCCLGLGVVALQADDGIMVLGSRQSFVEASSGQIVLEHFDADGRLDTGFGADGLVATDFFVSDGKVVPADKVDVETATPVDTSPSLMSVESEWMPVGDTFGQTCLSLMLGESDAHHWIGEDGGYWNDAGNWEEGLPEAGDSLVFTTENSGPIVTHNDFDAGTIFRSITFADDSFTLDGNAVSLIDGITVNSGGGSAISLDGIVLIGPANISVAEGESLTVSSVLSGSGTLTKTGTGTLTLSGENDDYVGVTTITAGTLKLGNDDALGNVANGVHVNGANAVLDLDGYSPTVDAVVLSDGYITNNGDAATLTSSQYTVMNGEVSARPGWRHADQNRLRHGHSQRRQQLFGVDHGLRRHLDAGRFGRMGRSAGQRRIRRGEYQGRKDCA